MSDLPKSYAFGKDDFVVDAEALSNLLDPLSYSNLMRNVIRNEDGTVSPRMSPAYSGDAGDETDAG